MTLQELIDNLEEWKPHLAVRGDRVDIQQVKVTRSVGTRTILFSGISRDREMGVEHIGRTVQMQFLAPPGVDVTNHVPSITEDRVYVRSSSPWFKYALAYPLKDAGALFGRVSPFQVKGTGKPVNEKRIAAIDKHLLALTKALLSDRLIQR